MKIKLFVISLLLVSCAFAGIASMPQALIDADRPMIVFEYNWWDVDGVGFITDSNFNATDDVDSIEVCGTHDITSGYRGTQTVYDGVAAGDYVISSLGNVAEGTTNITALYSTSCTDGDSIAIMTLEDDVMFGLWSATKYTTAAWSFFDNAINWAWDASN